MTDRRHRGREEFCASQGCH